MIVNDLQRSIAKNINNHIEASNKYRIEASKRHIDADDADYVKNPFTYNEEEIATQFLDKDHFIGLVPNPGSHMIESDMACEEYWQYNYSITTKTKLIPEARNKLFELSQYLQALNQSKNLIIKPINKDSNKAPQWIFDKIEVPNEPYAIQEDLQGTAMYAMDVAVFIYKNKGVL